MSAVRGSPPAGPLPWQHCAQCTLGRVSDSGRAVGGNLGPNGARPRFALACDLMPRLPAGCPPAARRVPVARGYAAAIR